MYSFLLFVLLLSYNLIYISAPGMCLYVYTCNMAGSLVHTMLQ
jgi:hypothetical protein